MSLKGSCGENIYWELDIEGNMTITGTGNGMEYVHTYWDGEELWTDPTSIDGVQDKIVTLSFEEGITGISNLFSECKNLISINLPKSLIKIGEAAFINCENLKSVVIPESVREIKNNAFYGCKKLGKVICESEQIQFGTSVFKDTLWLKSQDDFVVLGKTLLDYNGTKTKVTIPDTVDTVAGYAFSANPYVEEVIWNSQIKNVPSDCFRECANLISVHFPEGVMCIGTTAFFNCVKLVRVDLPESLVEIKNEVFLGCRSLKEITLPDSLNKIGYDAFRKCIELKSIRIPDNITSLNGTFHKCTSLCEVILGENIQSIGSYTFCECENLREIHFTKSMPKVEAFAFHQTPLKKSMNFEPEFLIEKGVLEEYRGHDKKVVVPLEVKRIGKFAFEYCDELEEVDLSKVEYIESFAFEYCEKLTKIKLSDNLIEIKANAFSECKSLKELIMPVNDIRMGASVWNWSKAIGEIHKIKTKNWKIYVFHLDKAYNLCDSLGEIQAHYHFIGYVYNSAGVIKGVELECGHDYDLDDEKSHVILVPNQEYSFLYSYTDTSDGTLNKKSERIRIKLIEEME